MVSLLLCLRTECEASKTNQRTSITWVLGVAKLVSPSAVDEGANFVKHVVDVGIMGRVNALVGVPPISPAGGGGPPCCRGNKAGDKCIAPLYKKESGLNKEKIRRKRSTMALGPVNWNPDAQAMDGRKRFWVGRESRPEWRLSVVGRRLLVVGRWSFQLLTDASVSKSRVRAGPCSGGRWQGRTLDWRSQVRQHDGR